MENFKQIKDDLKTGYQKTFELCLIAALLLVISLLYAVPDTNFVARFSEIKISDFEVIDIPQTHQFRLPPPPPRPHIPLPTESELLPADALVVPINMDFNKIVVPPAPPNANKNFIFIPHEVPPKPIAGYRAIQKRIIYPEFAVKNNIEDKVVLGILVDEHGRADKIVILRKAERDVGFEAAAINAVNGIKWKPAQQHDRAVKVWVAIPFRFVVQ